MVITNELIGKIILLSFVFGSVMALSLIHLSYLRRNYILRKDIGRQIWNTTVHSTLFVAVWFFTPISTFFKDSIITFLFNKDLKNGEYSYLVFFLVIISVIPLFSGRTILQKNRYLVPLKYFAPLISIFLLYGYYRFFSNEYIFYSVLQSDEKLMIKTLDLVMVVVLIYTSIAFVYSICEVKQKKTYSSLLLVDSPLADKAEDEFDRRKYYKSTIETLSTVNGKDGKALSIGLVNRWGEGKTSFIRFLKEELERDTHTLFIEFNAWHSSNGNNLTLDFFQNLDYELSKYVYTGSVLRKYAKNLTNINSVFNPFKYLPDNWIGEKSNKEYFKIINSLFTKLGRRVVVVVDDLDRLDNKEVLEVFRVIRNSANFNNVVFITPFDKEYVVHSLRDMKIHNPEDYIKKIFDVEISLPAISELHMTRIFGDYFRNALRKLNQLNADDEDKLNDQISRILENSRLVLTTRSKYTVISIKLFKYLKTKRDSIRFINSLVVTLRDSHDLLYLPDVLLIELIKYINVTVFRELFETKDYFISKSKNGSHIKENHLFYEGIDGSAFIPMSSYNIKDKIGKLDYNEKDDILELIEALFSEPLSNDFNHKHSFYYSNNYSSYHQFNEPELRKDIEDLFTD